MASNAERSSSARRLDYADYTVGWICALPLEVAAACAMFDNTHEPLSIDSIDTNTYTYGNVGRHNVVVAGMGRYGTNSAAHVISNMNRTFPRLYIRLLVGIGGGVPSQVEDFDMRLGDIVVGQEVIQYDQEKILSEGRTDSTMLRGFPHPKLLNAVSTLRARLEMSPSRVLETSKEALRRNPQMRDRFSLPESVKDRLYNAGYDHPGTPTCDGCDPQMLIARPERGTADPEIHYGAIASGNKVIKDGRARDRLSSELNAICFEMEAAGILRETEFLAIRGICDYADSHKNKAWQRYAALISSAYAKELLMVVPTIKLTGEGDIEDKSKSEAIQKVEQKRQALMNLLMFSGIGSREDDVRPAQGTTCQWMLEHPEYLTWTQSQPFAQGCGLLWISGKPGSGKSTMMKFLWEHQRNISQVEVSVNLSFFFYARGFDLQRNVEGMYRSLLHQLLTAHPHLQAVLDTAPFQDACPSIWELRKLFRAAVFNLVSSRVVIFIDAVDECAESQVRDMVDFFEDLSLGATKREIPLRICFASRHYPYVRLRHGLKMTLESQAEHETDMKTYLDARVLFNMERSFPDVRVEILRKASGVFLWVVLVTGILNKVYQQGSMFDVEGTVHELPDELSDLFRTILNRDGENMERFRLSILWLLYAERPLFLPEFYQAICSGLPSATARSSLATTVGEEDMERFATSSAKGFIEVYMERNVIRFLRRTTLEHPTVRFIHESVRDFLVRYKGLAEAWPELAQNPQGIGHMTLFKCCNAYLKLAVERVLILFEGFEVHNNASDSFTSGLFTSDLFTSDFPFLSYATDNIFYHANLLEDQSAQYQFLENLNLDVMRLSSWFQVLQLGSRLQIPRLSAETKRFRLMYYSVFFKAPSLIRSGYFEDMKLNTVEAGPKATGHPLFVALGGADSESVQALLELNHSIPEHCLLFDYVGNEKSLPATPELYPSGMTPLEWAVRRGYTCLGRCFIANGARINSPTHGPANLTFATMEHDKSMVTMLLEHGQDINRAHDAGMTALGAAVVLGNDDMVQFLIEKGAQVSAYSGSWGTLLHYASYECSEAMVKMLLECDEAFDISTLNRQSRTPLEMACARESGPKRAIAELLIMRGSVDESIFSYQGEIFEYQALHWDDDLETVVAQGVHGRIELPSEDWFWQLD